MIWPKRLLHLVWGGAALWGTRELRLPWTIALGIALALVLVLEGALQLLVGRRRRRFEQKLTALLQGSRNDELLPLYRDERLLRFAAPRHFTLGKLGLIHARLGQHAPATVAYEEALLDAPQQQRYALALGLGASLFELGRDAEAERIYRSVMDDDRINVQACANLSRLIRRRGGEAEEAERYLRQAVEAARGGLLRAELVHLLAEQDKIEEAREQLALATTELAPGSEKDRAALAAAQAALAEAAARGPAADEPAVADGVETLLHPEGD